VKHLFAMCAVALLGLGAGAGAAKQVIVPSAGVELPAYIYPGVKDKPGPAIVMLHGCSGLLDKKGKPIKSYVFWAEHFQKLGYTALLVDSYTPRGVKEICTQRDRAILPERERSHDAHAALAWLRKHPDVDPTKIHLMGWSNGAMTVLHAIRVNAAGAVPGVQFRAAVAMYPGCAGVNKLPDYEINAPLLIQSGAADDWTPAKPCAELVSRLAKTGADATMDSYPGAYHSFDRLDLPVRFRADVRNPSSPTGWGATIGSNLQARDKAITRITAFILARDRR
jgi:dienelactone hydrolase